MSGAVRVGQLAVAAVALSPKRDPEDLLAKALDYLAVPTGSQRVMCYFKSRAAATRPPACQVIRRRTEYPSLPPESERP